MIKIANIIGERHARDIKLDIKERKNYYKYFHPIGQKSDEH